MPPLWTKVLDFCGGLREEDDLLSPLGCRGASIEAHWRKEDTRRKARRRMDNLLTASGWEREEIGEGSVLKWPSSVASGSRCFCLHRWLEGYAECVRGGWSFDCLCGGRFPTDKRSSELVRVPRATRRIWISQALPDSLVGQEELFEAWTTLKAEEMWCLQRGKRAREREMARQHQILGECGESLREFSRWKRVEENKKRMEEDLKKARQEAILKHAEEVKKAQEEEDG